MKQQGLPFNTPMFRKEDPETSLEAAKVVEQQLGKIQIEVLKAFHNHGAMTARKAERLPEFEEYGFSTIRKRISELHRGGRLVEVGVDRSGNAPATIYRIVLKWR